MRSGTAAATEKPQAEALPAALGMSVSELMHAVGGFDCDPADMVRASVRTAERAFAELDVCDDVIDEASEAGGTIVDRLRAHLSAESAADIAVELRELDTVAARVRSTDETRRLLNRLLGREDRGASAPATVVRLAPGDLPALLSVYAESDDYSDLLAVAGRGEQLRPQLKRVHADRLVRVASHLVAVVERVSAVGFADKHLADESLREARRSYELWQRCLEERRRDLS
ncbi:hypothetical protein [Streptomyces sp. Je 1-369]|uniref:hypothetical protein n=1 Tax=Streptomyces sp. Je 1-369 TaxID=2966192 RepID=UPI002286A818|nr:hypothetical protein [Streptomyces sp. Je 1-369]WAL98854.1 hypothetical protein NOO62_32870 [Streptomyces sp. Je 1-369]